MFRRFVKLLPNLLVLGLLGGLFTWGHLTHWKLPGAAGAHANAHESVAHANASIPAPTAGAAEDELNAVKFNSPEEIERAGMAIGQVEERPMDEWVVANGVVAYDQTRLAQLSVRVPGTVWRVEQQVGQSVRKGEVLVILDAADVGRAKSEFLQSIVHYDVKARNFERLKTISELVPERQLRDSEADVREARVRRFNAQQALINLGLPVVMDEIKGLTDDELAAKVHFLGLPASLTESLDPRTTTANLLPLAAPFDGVLIGHELTVGEVVEASRPHLTLADVRKMWITLAVAREDAGRLEIGQDMTFTADGVPGEVCGAVSWISTEVDVKTRTVQVRAEVDNPSVQTDSGAADGPRVLRANVFGTGRIRVRAQPRALVVPGNALHRRGTQQVVFVPGAGGRNFLPRAVRTGVSRNGFTEIVEGVSRGESIVTTGSYMLKAELFGAVE